MLGRKETRNEETISFVRGLLEGEYKQKNGEKIPTISTWVVGLMIDGLDIYRASINRHSDNFICQVAFLDLAFTASLRRRSQVGQDYVTILSGTFQSVDNPFG